MLLLKRHLVDLVRRGKKRQTIRLWTKPLLRAGQISYTPGLGKMKITAVDKLPSLAALTEADARADGFDSLAALKAEIKKIYGPAASASRVAAPSRSAPAFPARTLFRIQFEWPIDDAGKKLVIPPAQPAAAPAPVRRPAIPSPAVHPPTAPRAVPRAEKTHSASRPRTKRSTRMTPHEQQQLRTFILSHHPRHKKSSHA